jgi:hypothetical protein
MQYRPTAAELLATIADLLEDEVLGAVPPALQHKVRVAGNLCRILEREWALTPAAAAKETALWADLLGHEGDLLALRTELAERLRSGDVDASFERRAWDAIVAVTRDDLAIAKPGHDAWEGV